MIDDAHYHIHINIFEKEIPEGIAVRLKQESFKLVPYRILGEDWEPVWIITTKRVQREAASSLFEAVTAQLRETTLVGYVELERMSHSNVFRVPEGAWRTNTSPFPLLDKPEFVHAPRGADIHIFRNLTKYPDDLDRLLSSLGFYPVRNTEQEIWTLLTENMADAQRLFDELKPYFLQALGVFKVEVEEILERLEPIQKDFPFRPVAKRGFCSRRSD